MYNDGDASQDETKSEPSHQETSSTHSDDESHLDPSSIRTPEDGDGIRDDNSLDEYDD